MSNITIDTLKLTDYAKRIYDVNKKIKELDDKLDSLYTKVGLLDLWDLIQADALTGYSFRLLKCQAYLNQTATDFINLETNLTKALETGSYDVFEKQLPRTVPRDIKDIIKELKFDKKDAFKEAYDLLIDGELDCATFIDWVLKNFWEDEATREKIFGDNPNLDKVEWLYKLLNEIVDTTSFFTDASDIANGTAEFGGDLDGLGVVSLILSMINSWDAQYDVALGLASIIMGTYLNDKDMAMAGAEYFDEGASKYSDVAMSASTAFGPYGWLVGLYVDYSINSITNRMKDDIYYDFDPLKKWQDILSKSPLEYQLSTPEFRAFIETANDNLAGNFICQQYVKTKYQEPTQAIMNAVFDTIESNTGIDARDVPIIDSICSSDNWLNDVYNLVDGLVN